MTSPMMGGMAGDPYESFQDVEELNSFTLIGCTDERGDAWHRRDDLMGNGNNHFSGLIPRQTVIDRLFGWTPERREVAYLIPVEGATAATVLAAGTQGRTDIVVMGGEVFRVSRTEQSRIGVLRSDNDYDLGVFSSRAMHPPYTETLMREAEKLTGTTLGISSAGCLQKGARAWVEFSVKETMIDPKSGFGYRPNLVHADSMDGSVAYTKALTINATVCMNTLRTNLLEAREAGTIVRRKHTSGILDPRKYEGERAALGLLEQVNEQFVADLHKLIETPVNERQRIELLDVIVPLGDDLSERSYKLAEAKRDSIMAMGRSPMVEPWIGTAFGELQRYSTWQHWSAPHKGTGQWERNAWRDVMGKSAEADALVIAGLEKVLA